MSLLVSKYANSKECDSLSLVERIKNDLGKKSVELPLPSPQPGPLYSLAISINGVGVWRGGFNGVAGDYEWYVSFR